MLFYIIITYHLIKKIHKLRRSQHSKVMAPDKSDLASRHPAGLSVRHAQEALFHLLFIYIYV